MRPLTNLTPEIATGNVCTVNDAYDATKSNNGAKNQLGAAFAVDSPLTTGEGWKVRYVRINSTVAPVEVVGPVYWKDAAHTTVTAVMSEGLTGKQNSIAGVLLNKDITNGNYGFILVNGYYPKMTVAAATAIDDAIIGAAAQATAKIASGTAPTFKVLAIALEAIDGDGKANVDVCVEAA